MNRERAWIHIRDSFWFLPTIYSILSIICVSLVTMVDLWIIPKVKENIPSILLMNTSAAQTLYGSLITSILTMTTISFSTIMVVLTTYSTQFSPRTLQDFMKSRVTQHVLGVFSFGFIFVIINLLLMGSEQSKELISPFLTVIVSIVCLAFFILFIHHSSRFVQVNNLIGTIRSSTSKVIKKTYEAKNYYEFSDWNEQVIRERKKKRKKIIYARESGYAQTVGIPSLIEWASKRDTLIEADFFVGSYLQKGMPVFYCWSDTEEEEALEGCHDYLLIGNERTDLQDIEFSLQKLVEIAVKAISPSTNDPHTAVNCINRIGSLLAELGAVYEPIRYFADGNKELCLIMEPIAYEEYLYKSFYQIRIYGSQDISVMNGVLEALYKVAVVNDDTVKGDVWEFGVYMMKAVHTEQLDELDFKHFKHQVEKLADSCNETISFQR
ncbi:DUF2254 domain-containing protein [Halobacillus shinanisalinarum]|uniref:DUF2254 domain-containing protein n=1 Tax=Halobacillus shinanisalinarum TaxID=2932258 RepID=A0ABY4GUY3_9BACI|nr:DUF2254 domain-containing protein [Halobacillus shinanisalinarum]UOQ91761.1 DUF2254 domain-containing protein [Halobacillus shinanisalinarum]